MCTALRQEKVCSYESVNGVTGVCHACRCSYMVCGWMWLCCVLFGICKCKCPKMKWDAVCASGVIRRDSSSVIQALRNMLPMFIAHLMLSAHVS